MSDDPIALRRLAATQDTLRIDVMERLDRMQDAPAEIRNDVGANRLRAHDAAESARDDM